MKAGRGLSIHIITLLTFNLPRQSTFFVFSILFFIYLRQFLKKQFYIHSKIERKVWGFPKCFLLPYVHNFYHISILHQSGTFVTIAKPPLAYCNHPKPIVYTRVHSWCCYVIRVWKMPNDMYPPLYYHTKYFHCPKNLSAPSLRVPIPWHPLIFLLPPGFCIFQNVIQLESSTTSK